MHLPVIRAQISSACLLRMVGFFCNSRGSHGKIFDLPLDRPTHGEKAEAKLRISRILLGKPLYIINGTLVGMQISVSLTLIEEAYFVCLDDK